MLKINNTNNLKKKKMSYIFLFVLFLIPISVFAKFMYQGTISGTIVIPARENVLSLYYKVKEAFENGKANQYTGNGSDTYENNVYYYSVTSTENNVIFGNFCWKILRTTDTGGVKMIYNGKPSGGKCTGTNIQIGTSTFNSNTNSLAYVGYMYNTTYQIKSREGFSSSNIQYGSNFTYNGTTYTLTNATTVSNQAGLSNRHYTCFTAEKTCETIGYIVKHDGSNSRGTVYYIELQDGKSINDAINEMLTDDEVNKKSSNIKTVVDNWYQNNMLSYANYLEDTVFCNNRKIRNYGGWSTSGLVTANLQFEGPNVSDLSCTNQNDRFTVNENIGNGKLTYPVGLISSEEQGLIKLTGSIWTMSPHHFTYEAYESSMTTNSTNSSAKVSDKLGVRPVISLKSGMEVESGEGTTSSPYVIKIG